MRNYLRYSLAAVAMIASTPVMAVSFDVTGDWRNGVFKYGYGDVGNTFTEILSPSNDGTFDGFRGPTGTNVAILKNISGGPLVAGDFFFSTGGVVIGPGEQGLDSIIRFTAPISGRYSVNGTLTPVWNIAGGNGLDAILFAGSTLIGNTLQPASSFGTVQSFSYDNVQLGVGESLYFGIDSRGELSFDITELAARISLVPAVPEPSTWVMMIVGFGMVGFAMRRRSKVRTTVSYA